MSRVVAVALGLAIAGSAQAQTEAPPATDEVTVTGLSDSAVSRFVREIAQPTGEGKLARWDRAVCPGTVGFQRKYAEFVNERVAQVARDAGLKVRASGCSPDVLIVATADPEQIAAALDADYRRQLGLSAGADDQLSTPGRVAFQRFLKSEAPVRWWHVSSTVSADGYANPSKRMKVFSPSRLKASTQEVFDSVLILIDTRKLQGFTYESLADYVAMAALAQVDPEADPGRVDTVLAMFEGGPRALTVHDRGFLAGLYGARADASGLQAQRGSILRTMKRARRDPSSDKQ